jgi:hypothetical protein
MHFAFRQLRQRTSRSLPPFSAMWTRDLGAGTSRAAPVTSPLFEWTTAHEIEQVPQVTHLSGAKLTFLKFHPSEKSGFLL